MYRTNKHRCVFLYFRIHRPSGFQVLLLKWTRIPRKKVLGLDEVHIYDLYTPLVKDSGMKVTYEEAKDYMLKGLAPLGEEYASILKEGLENRWVDVYENKGKRSGAYSSGTYRSKSFEHIIFRFLICDLHSRIFYERCVQVINMDFIKAEHLFPQVNVTV